MRRIGRRLPKWEKIVNIFLRPPLHHLLPVLPCCTLEKIEMQKTWYSPTVWSLLCVLMEYLALQLIWRFNLGATLVIGCNVVSMVLIIREDWLSMQYLLGGGRLILKDLLAVRCGVVGGVVLSLALGTVTCLGQAGAVGGAVAGLPDAPGVHSESGDGSVAGSVAASQQMPVLSVHERAERELREQGRQRVVGIVPAFNTSYRMNAAPLTVSQKFKLALRSVSDPEEFAEAFVTGGYKEVFDGDRTKVKGTPLYRRENGTGFEWGPSGYFERVGAGYLDSFDSTMLGKAIFPSLLHQDPRFFRLGHGAVVRRLLYAASTSFVCKHDSGRWEPNYSKVLGNIAAGEISNFYYPSGDAGAFTLTLNTAMIQTVEGSLKTIFQEFWPDLSRKFFHKDPTRGIDAENQAKYAAQDAARKSRK